MLKTKLALLFSTLLKRPLEFYDRVMTLLEVRLERCWVKPPPYETTSVEGAVRGMEIALGQEVCHFLGEEALAEIEDEVRQRTESIRSSAPFTLAHNADFILARFCYLVCRALKPENVLETGVAYGVTSAFILKALEVSGQGALHSVDLPPLGRYADRFVGILIPEDLKARWRLHRGVSKRVLPCLLPTIGQVEVFLHDSLHTHRNMRQEFRLVTPYLSPRAVVIADDVDGNPAFREWMEMLRPEFWAVVKEREKESLFGIGIKVDAYPSGA